MRIIIVGAGDTGIDLARKLGDRENVDLVIIDTDEKRCDLASNELNALVLKGDGTDPEILKQAQISEADVLVALTGSDPLNTVVSMLGRRFDVKKIMVKLNGLALRSACQSIGVYKIITPKISTADEILALLRGNDVRIPHGKTTLEENDEMLLMIEKEKDLEKVKEEMSLDKEV
jgi:trk system potassium uptake protein TrkA